MRCCRLTLPLLPQPARTPPLTPLPRTVLRVLARARYSFSVWSEEDRRAAEAALEERLGRKPSGFENFCRDQNLGPDQGGPSSVIRDYNSWRTRGWVMGVPPLNTDTSPAPRTSSEEPTPSAEPPPPRARAPSAGAGAGMSSTISSREERRRELADFDFTPRELKARLDEVVVAQVCVCVCVWCTWTPP